MDLRVVFGYFSLALGRRRAQKYTLQKVSEMVTRGLTGARNILIEQFLSCSDIVGKVHSDGNDEVSLHEWQTVLKSTKLSSSMIDATFCIVDSFSGKAFGSRLCSSLQQASSAALDSFSGKVFVSRLSSLHCNKLYQLHWIRSA
jgi:hypothetical protein